MNKPSDIGIGIIEKEVGYLICEHGVLVTRNGARKLLSDNELKQLRAWLKETSFMLSVTQPVIKLDNDDRLTLSESKVIELLYCIDHSTKLTKSGGTKEYNCYKEKNFTVHYYGDNSIHIVSSKRQAILLMVLQADWNELIASGSMKLISSIIEISTGHGVLLTNDEIWQFNYGKMDHFFIEEVQDMPNHKHLLECMKAENAFRYDSVNNTMVNKDVILHTTSTERIAVYPTGKNDITYYLAEQFRWNRMIDEYEGVM